jgi:hypothetical protein
MEELCGLVEPPNWRADARFTKFEAKDGLPASFDWRPLGGCTPIKSQRACGSCWAFATVGAFECSILIKDGEVVNLAEQWLVSCNQETETPHVLGKGGWGCNGGWWAHDYFTGAKTDPCGEAGAVLTVYSPYYGNVPTCDCPYPHDYAMDSWAFIAGEDVIPEVNAIKEAIMLYGPVCAAVYVNNAFLSYDNGVFNDSADQEVNHAIVLVGWDDEQGTSGVWILRNSWNYAWGEGGYMRIEYGCSRVGYGACYVNYAGRGQGVPAAITSQPGGGVTPQGWYHYLSVAATGVGTMHYQWQHDGEDVGTDSPVYLIRHATPADSGTYTCRVRDARGVAVSDPAELFVDPSLPVPATGFFGLSLLGILCGLAARRSLSSAR